MAVDRLNIVAHDKFQEIIDEANRPDSANRVQAAIVKAVERRQPSPVQMAEVPTGTRRCGQNQRAGHQTIDIRASGGRRITGFRFRMRSLNYPAVARAGQHLRTNPEYWPKGARATEIRAAPRQCRCDLAGQVVRHFQDYLSQEETRKILRLS
ncbi:MAG: hypothetical protein U5J82_00680 [Desulfobacterales bacterium]|nr:hypothetical protein [Desulfobacterales bacterium]